MAAVAFFSNSNLVRFRKGDVLIVDASDDCIKSNETTAKALAAAVRLGTSVFSLPNLHAKVFVFDRVAVVGSANVSRHSSSSLIEAALVTDDSATAGQAKALLESLKEMATPVDAAFLKRISKLRVRPRAAGERQRRKKRQVGRLGRRTWLVRVRELREDAFPKEKERAEAGEKVARTEVSDKRSDVSWIRWAGRGQFARKAEKGDSVIEVWKSLNKRTVEVRRAAPVLRRQREPTCTRFYIEEPPGRERSALPLKVFRELAKRAGISRQIGKNPQRVLSEDTARLIALLWHDFAGKQKRRKG
jgi:hypothetical protein